MEAEKLRQRDLSGNAAQQYDHLQKLLTELSSKTETTSFNSTIRQEVMDLNAIPEDVTEKELLKGIERTKSSLFSKVAKELKIVPKYYYRNLWMALGMSSFGIPLGVVFGITLDNMALLALGLPLGMAVGIGYGTYLDNKAKEEGYQLNLGLQLE